MSCDSIQSFGHPEWLNISIIDAIGHCRRIRKNVTDREKRTENRQRIENRETNYRGHLNRRWITGLSGPIKEEKNYFTNDLSQSLNQGLETKNTEDLDNELLRKAEVS